MPSWWIMKRSFSFDLDGCMAEGARFATAPTGSVRHESELG